MRESRCDDKPILDRGNLLPAVFAIVNKTNRDHDSEISWLKKRRIGINRFQRSVVSDKNHSLIPLHKIYMAFLGWENLFVKQPSSSFLQSLCDHLKAVPQIIRASYWVIKQIGEGNILLKGQRVTLRHGHLGTKRKEARTRHPSLLDSPQNDRRLDNSLF